VELLWRALYLDRSHVPTLKSLAALLLERGEYLEGAGVAFQWCLRSPASREAHASFRDVIEAGTAAGAGEGLRPWMAGYAEQFPEEARVQRWLQPSGLSPTPGPSEPAERT
jgi:hypothetical protein